MGEAKNVYPNLNDQSFILNKINETKDYFIADIRDRELMSKRLSEYIASFDYFDISLIVLFATSVCAFIGLFATVTDAPVGITSASFSFALSTTTGIVKKLLKAARNKKKKYSKIVLLAGSNLNSIEKIMYEALIDNEISHKDFEPIINE